ncbi:hypothetical protein TNCV_3421381 [Trichonephila clavipes]|nr:hypothetical protein TNCV_3421381 [Trichonephila clavipes]
MEPVRGRRFQLFVAKTLTRGQAFLEVQENVKIVGSKIEADKLTPSQIPSKLAVRLAQKGEECVKYSNLLHETANSRLS